MTKRSLIPHTVLSIFLTLLLCTAVTAADPQAIRYYEDALELFNAGDQKSALIQVKNSLQRDPGQLPAKILLGRIHLALGRPEPAEEQFVQAGQLGADPFLFALPLAKARNALGKSELNVETIRPVGMPPGPASDLWVELGIARLASGDLIGADIAFEEALRLSPRKVTATLGLASVQLHREDYGKAEILAAEALADAPESANAWFMLGVVMQKKRQLEGAEAHFSEARRLQPDHVKATLAEATLKLHRGLAAEAAPLAQGVLDSRPWSLEAAYILYQALHATGENEAAQKALEHALNLVSKVTPADLAGRPSLMLLASLVAYETGRHETSYGFVSAYLQLKPEDARAREHQAKLLLAMEKPLPASRILRSLANQYPRVPRYQIMLGDVSIQLKDYSQAEKHYSHA